MTILVPLGALQSETSLHDPLGGVFDDLDVLSGETGLLCYPDIIRERARPRSLRSGEASDGCTVS